MSADMHTKGFNDVSLYRRLRKLNNIFTPDEVINTRGEIAAWNPDPLTFDKKDAPELPTFNVSEVNSQYQVLNSGTSLQGSDDRKPVKKKPGPKRKAMAHVVMSPAPNWFVQYNFGVSRFQPPQGNESMPECSDVTLRRTYCYHSAQLLQQSRFPGNPGGGQLPSADEYVGRFVQVVDGGKLRDLVSFFYTSVLPTDGDILSEKECVRAQTVTCTSTG